MSNKQWLFWQLASCWTWKQTTNNFHNLEAVGLWWTQVLLLLKLAIVMWLKSLQICSPSSLNTSRSGVNWVRSWGNWQPNSLATTMRSLGSLWSCGFALMTGQSGTSATQSSATPEDVAVSYFQVFLVPFIFQLRMAALCKCCIFSPGCSAFPCANTGAALAPCAEMRISP